MSTAQESLTNTVNAIRKKRLNDINIDMSKIWDSDIRISTSTETRITMMFLQGSINQRKRKLLNLKGKVSSKKDVLKAINRDIIRAEDKLLNNDCLFRPSKRRRLNETIKPMVRGSTIGIDWDRSNSKIAKTINFSDSIEETVSDED